MEKVLDSIPELRVVYDSGYGDGRPSQNHGKY